MRQNHEQWAVKLNSVVFSYGFGIKSNLILNGINISVPANGIYALIGPSGCGKTSILRMIMGYVDPDYGTVTVFGHKPGSRKSPIPGKDIGYMPQDTALNSGLTVHEMMKYFGRVYGMSSRMIRKSIDHLVATLNIPDMNQVIGTLSGGQKRRVSFACAVMHKPRLAMLDEPTVGVDPMLVEKIWKYMIQMTKDGTTIILTTHYIEETKRANKIGFVKQGILVAEEHSKNILNRLQVCFSSLSLSHSLTFTLSLSLHSSLTGR